MLLCVRILARASAGANWASSGRVTAPAGDATQTVWVLVSTPPPTVTLAAALTTINAGQSTTLTWSSTHATDVVSSNFGATDVSGTKQMSPSWTTTYTITVSGPWGQASASADVTVIGGGASNQYQFAAQWGSEGSGNGQFSRPRGVAVDGAGCIYVADAWNHRIQKLTGQGAYLSQWGSAGTTAGRFQYPEDVAVDRAGSIYVCDTFNSRIQRFDTVGGFIAEWGTVGTGDANLNFPRGVAVDTAGNVYVADSGNNRIQKFAPVTP